MFIASVKVICVLTFGLASLIAFCNEAKSFTYIVSLLGTEVETTCAPSSLCPLSLPGVGVTSSPFEVGVRILLLLPSGGVGLVPGSI